MTGKQGVCDFVCVYLLTEEAEKRAHESGDGFFRAVGFNYNAQPPAEEASPTPAHLPELPEHPPTSAVDIVGRGAPFIMPNNLVVPGHVKLVCFYHLLWDPVQSVAEH